MATQITLMVLIKTDLIRNYPFFLRHQRSC